MNPEIEKAFNTMLKINKLDYDHKKASMNRACLQSEEYKRFIEILKKDPSKTWIFTDSMEYRSSPPPGQRELSNKAANYVKNLITLQNEFPDSMIITDLDIEYTKKVYTKHAMGLIFIPGEKENILEIFNPNGKLYLEEQNDSLVELLNIVKNLLEKFKPVRLKDASKNLNTEGMGHCAAWVIYYYYLRPENINTKFISNWEPQDIYEFNNIIRKVNKANRLD